ncbi:MAG: hypothetical protein P8N43_08765 [Alphaproteobacteria bacterium]|nr:hypothetical protein [Alphaproteobacteria bacterium]
MSKELENALSEAGFAISDTPPVSMQEENVAETPVAHAPPVADNTTTTEPEGEAQQDIDTPVQEVQESKPVDVPEPVQELTPQKTESIEDIDVETEVLRFLSEKLGSEYNSFDSLSEAILSKPAEIDERVAAINEFVKSTGRSPEDWYKYQQMNPSEMDDLTAVRNQMIVEHENLSIDEVNMLVNNKYNLDSEQFEENTVAMAKLQLKMDAESARKSISKLRDGYQLPVNDKGETEPQSPITEDWVRNMTKEVQDFDGLIFDLPSGEKFTYGINDDYRKALVSKNSRLEEYFDDYLGKSGDWNFEKLNADRAVVDNIDSIVKSVYQQGLSDGQRKVVENAANVSSESPQRSTSNSSNSVAEQIRNALGGGKTLSIT